MAIRIILVTVLLSYLLGEEASVMAEREKPVAGVSGLTITEKDIPAFERKALDGDPDAARRLSSFYQIRSDRSQAIYWATIAAENGSVVGQYNLGFLLRDDPDPKNQRRAIYWLKRAAESGDEMAAQLLKEISGK
jgi:TPR repeat protein